MSMIDIIIPVSIALILSQHFHFRHKLTPLKVSLCLLVVTGVILVVQPSFIFGEKHNFINTTEYTQETSILPKLPEYNMTLGALISLVCALSAGFINVSAAKTKGTVWPRTILIKVRKPCQRLVQHYR